MRALVLICPTTSLFMNDATGAAPVRLQTEDEQAIQKLLADFTGAWNRHDMKAFSELFTE